MRKIQHSYQLKFPQTEEMLKVLSKEGSVPRYLEALKDYSFSTFEHSYRVGLLCVDIGFENGIKEEEIKLLGYSGLFHDIGKIRIPLPILDKRTVLTPLERELINEHVRVGFDVVRELGDDLRRIIVGHHEYHSNPYPRKGTERRNNKRRGTTERRKNNPIIETLTQILAASDFYDALRSERVYQHSKGKKETRQLMLKNYTGDQKYVSQLLER